MKLAWLTDIHLNFLRPPALEAFLDTLAVTEADAFAISGDIAEADDVAVHMHAIADRAERPAHFVLGNHDFYRGSIAGVRKKVRSLCSVTPNLHWLSDVNVVPLTDEACLVGHDGWGDGRFGDYHGSDVMLNDFGLIEEFAGFDEGPAERLTKLHAPGNEADAHFRDVLPDARYRFKRVVVLPFFSCEAVGDVLAQAMAAAPDRKMTVLCGHPRGR